MDKKEKDPNKGQIHSPSGREQTLKNAGGMPPKLDVEEIFKNATPPKRYAQDSTEGIGKP